MKNKNSIFWAFLFVLISNMTFGQCPYIEEVRLWDNSWNNPTGQSANNYANYSNNCIPLFDTQFTQINISSSQVNVYMAMYADLDGNGTFETQIFNSFVAGGAIGINPTLTVLPGTPIRTIVSASPITSGDIIPSCGEAEDYVICGDCEDCFNFFGIVPLDVNGCDYELVMDYAASGTCGAISIVSEDWDFGYPGGTGTGYYTTHTFPGNGSYTVTATIVYTIVATGETCTAVQTLNINVTGCTSCEDCFNFFGIVPLDVNGCDYELVMDYAASGTCGAISIVSEDWDFGYPGGTGTGYYTTHTFPGNGSYTVTATIVYTIVATGETCTAVQTLNINVTGCTSCEDCFNFFGIVPLDINGCDYELVMDYAASGTCGAISIVSEDWDFGYPGGTGTGYYTTHTFPGNGSYTITATIVYTVVATGETCTAVQTLNINVTGCTSCEDCFNFFGIEVLDSKACQYELVMDYAASGTCGAISIVSETWDFGYPGGTGSGYYTTHTFPGNGVYTITATIVYTVVATGQTCTAVQTRTIAVNGCNDCKCVNGGAIQTFSTGTDCALGFWLGGFGIDGCATLLSGYTWNFGDGTGAVTANNYTSHTYSASGTYAVTVSFNVQNNVTGAICTQTYTLIVHVDCKDGKVGKSLQADAETIELFNVRVFPNPSDDFVTFTVHNVDESIDFVKNPELVVYDQMGREVHRSNFNGEMQQTVDFRELGSGAYIYKIIQSDQMLNTGQLIIN